MADIRFDVSNLTYKKFWVLDQSSTTFDGSASEVLSLPSGTYTFRHPDIAAEFTFEVTPDGFINFSAAHDGFLSGRGTSTLVVRGFTISLDARTLSHDLVPLALAVLLARDRTHVLTLLPAKGYAFLPSSQFVGDFRFDVTTEGTVNYDQGYDGFASGRGSSQLVVGGFPITIDGTGLSHDLQPFLLWGNSEILSRDSTHLLTLLPAKGYAFLPSSQLVGDFRFDAAHLQMFCKYLDRSVTDCIRAFES